jgi:hypothetical protein
LPEAKTGATSTIDATNSAAKSSAKRFIIYSTPLLNRKALSS